MQIDHLGNIARRKLGRPTAVVASRECLDVPTTRIRVELADDSTSWANLQAIDVMVPGEEEAERLRFEAETGKCNVCGGDGQEYRGWSRESGVRYRLCVRCRGTGAAPASGSRREEEE